MKSKVANIVLYICLCIPVFAIGMIIGIRTQISDAIVYEDGSPIVCTITDHKSPNFTNPSNSSFRIEYSYEIDGTTKWENQDISKELFHQLCIGDKVLGFIYKDEVKVLFDIPVIQSDEQGITIQ